MKRKLPFVLFSLLMAFSAMVHAESYRLSFNANGGVNVTGGNFALPNIPCGMDQNGVGWVQVTIGAPYFYGMENECPTRSGYRFLGWYDAPKGGEQVYNSRGICVDGKYWRNYCWQWHGSIMLFAHWQEKIPSQQIGMATRINPMGNEHEYVDLGLSVKWASCNVGANAPEEYGNYYAWGEVVPKSDYSWETYKYCNGTNDSMTKYCTNSSLGTVDNKTTLEAMDDAATYNRGGSWRMPTDAEWTELREQCTWTWTTRNGVNGYEVTSSTTGNSVFLPAAGCRYDTDLYNAGSWGYYLSSSLYESEPDYTRDSFFNSDIIYRYSSYRYDGLSVRPVYP